jgi:hypothetical protein
MRSTRVVRTAGRGRLENGWLSPVLPQKEQLERMFDLNHSKLLECAYPLAECTWRSSIHVTDQRAVRASFGRATPDAATARCPE